MPHVPGSIASMRKEPDESVVVTRVSCVSWLTTVTDAFATTAPRGSRTSPANVPLLVCAMDCPHKAKSVIVTAHFIAELDGHNFFCRERIVNIRSPLRL